MPTPAPSIEEALATQKKHLYTVLLTALTGLLTAAWTSYSTPAERQVKSGYDLLVEANNVQSERIRKLELLISALLVNSGKDPTDVSAVFGEPDPVYRLIAPARPSRHLRPSPPTNATIPEPASAPEYLELSDQPEPPTSISELVQDVAEQAKMPKAAMPTFDSL